MAKKSNESSQAPVADYRRAAKRRNNPPAGIAAHGSLLEVGKIRYAYNPHRPPVLRSDATGLADSLQELLAAARTRRLTEEETRTLADGLRQHEPWLEWSGINNWGKLGRWSFLWNRDLGSLCEDLAELTR